MSDGQRIAVLEEAVIPLFQAISHEDVLSSLLLETAVDTIYNFLFGPSGRRAIRLFTYVAPTLHAIKTSSESNVVIGYVEASLAVLQKIVDLNGTALVLAEFYPLLQTMSECFEEDIPSVGNLPVHRARQSLSRIQRRLELGSAMSSAQMAPKNITDPLVTFEISQDMPGSLSVEGPRHDNDHEDITNIKIMPTTQEIQSHRSEYLPFRDPGAWHLTGIKGLLDRQFRLLREDTVGQLRDAVGLEVESLRNTDRGRDTAKNSKQGPRTIAYKHADLIDIEFDKRKGLQVSVEFDQPSAVFKMSPTQRRDWWENSKQLQMDSLLCLVDSEAGTIFLSAAQQINARDGGPTSETNDGHGTPEGHPSPIKPQNLFNHPQRAVAILRPVDTYKHDIKHVVNTFNRQHHPPQSLVEFPAVLLPSFRPTLQALQQMSRDTELPFAELLAPPPRREREPYVPPPPYALEEGFRFDLSCLLTNGRDLELSPGKRFDHEALTRGSTLDKAQADALVDALCRSLALVQGPPGTGKSYTGIALMKVLLENRNKARLGPIICVCYTNHALDQLLENLVHDGIKHIIRLGSRSKSQLLEPLNLRQIAQQQSKTKAEKHREWELRSEIDSNSSEIEGLLSDLKRADSWKSVKTYLEVNQSHHHDELFGDEEDGFQTVHHDLGKVINKWLRPKPSVNDRQGRKARQVRTLVHVSLQDMSQGERQKLHRHWVAEITDCIRENLYRALSSYAKAEDHLNQCRQEVNLRCLQQAHVIGVTTTGLAKNLGILRRLRSKVMLCEEAGEVLEAHTITALLPRIEHAILIGDHQQLRPQTQNYELQHENPNGEKYSLDVSLFERLVQPKGDWGIRIPFGILEIQRRMHPSIAQLVRDTLYPNLQDHPSVTGYADVFGFAKRLFWLDHQEPEAGTDPSRVTSTSHSNDFEVDMTAALVSHLVRQGKYRSDDIAVITPYLGQLQKMRRRMGISYEVVVSDRDAEDLEKEGLDIDDSDRTKPPTIQKTTLLKALRIATVDNFQVPPSGCIRSERNTKALQGEEAKVVIVSLVRSNPRNNCGFLKTSNRINVLLR
ncbi:MAG: hypothetical protein Q9179_006303 [Wetmoreana sp. 5 TL-2023]